VDEGDSADIVFLAFAKAFDKVPFKHLGVKPENHGIDGKLKRWIDEWLQGRYQWFWARSTSSGWRRVSSGVLQGSVLRPAGSILDVHQRPGLWTGKLDIKVC